MPYAICSRFHRDRHLNRLERVVQLIQRYSNDLVDHIEPPNDLAKDRVAPVQPTRIRHADKELGAVVVEIARAVAFSRDFGGGDSTSFVGTVARLGVQPIPGSPSPMLVPVRV